MTRQLNLFLLALLLLIGAPVYWLLLDTSPYDAPSKHLDIGELRQLANSMPGQKPGAVRLELSAWKRLPGDLLAAGSGLKRRMIGVISFQLEVPGSGPVVIDTGTSQRLGAAWGDEKFDPYAQARIDQQLRQASLILVTHEHSDHLGGLAEFAARKDAGDVLSRMMLNPAQLRAAGASPQLHWPHGVKPALDGINPQAVAPGVVVIPAPGHTPGSQMIFVQLASGAEYLFTGDTASLAANWREVRPRARLLSDFLAREDRPAVIGWLKAIAALKQAAPGLHVMASHDYDWLIDPPNRTGVIRLSSATPVKLSGT
ncbi:MAG: MBL fold metallo-hydrolase [Novosphingobium sp.]